MDAIEKARVLLEALPYIQRFRGKFVVVKLGGAAMETDEGTKQLLGSIVFLEQVGMEVILVHGGGPSISKEMKKRGKKPVFVSGHRVTDAETLEIVREVLVNRINHQLVDWIEELGGSAIGIYPGANGCLFGEKKIALGPDGSHIDLGFVGTVKTVATERLARIAAGGLIPVVAPLAEAENGSVLNVNADTAASTLAGQLRAEKFVLLTDVPGILRDKNDPTTLISSATSAEIARLIEDGVIEGGMIPKVDACLDALESGVKKAHILDGGVPYSILLEIFTDRGIGTEIVS